MGYLGRNRRRLMNCHNVCFRQEQTFTHIQSFCVGAYFRSACKTTGSVYGLFARGRVCAPIENQIGRKSDSRRCCPRIRPKIIHPAGLLHDPSVPDRTNSGCDADFQFKLFQSRLFRLIDRYTWAPISAPNTFKNRSEKEEKRPAMKSCKHSAVRQTGNQITAT